VDSPNKPLVLVFFQENVGIKFTESGTKSFNTYELSFIINTQDGHQLFKKVYNGDITGGSGTKDVGNRVYLGSDVTFDQLKNDITSKLESNPLRVDEVIKSW